MKYLCNLARYWIQAPWGCLDSIETCRSVIICEIFVHLLVIVQNKKYKNNINIFNHLKSTSRVTTSYVPLNNVASWGWIQKAAEICRSTFHHHHVHEGLVVFPVPRSSRRSWSLHLFLGHPMFFRPFVYIVALVFYLCPSSVRVVATFTGTVLFPLLSSVLPFFFLNTLILFLTL